MRRLFWLTLGALIGAWAVLRAQRLARQFGPRGVAQRMVGFGVGLRAFAVDVRSEMKTREIELRRTLDGPPAARRADRSSQTQVHDIDKDGH